MQFYNARPQFVPDEHGRNPLPSLRRRVVSYIRSFTGPQFRVLSCPKRFIVLAAGRRWGKTTVGLYKMLCHAAASPLQHCYFIAPTERQAGEIAWRTLLDITPRALVRFQRKSTFEVELINDSLIKLHGPESLRGQGLDFVLLDEFAYMPPRLWSEVVLPMLADRRGRALISSTPAGFNHFYELFVEAQTKPDWATFHFRTGEGSFVSDLELQLLRSTMGPKSYAQEIEARFEPQEGRIYQEFSREANVRELTPFRELTILVGLDFNVNPMTAVIGQRIGDECHIYNEVVLRNSHTREMMRELSRQYPQRGLVHPDPTGAARKTSADAGITDHDIIAQAGWDVYPSKPYPVINRINAVNALLRNANGRARLLIDPKCKHLIRSLEAQTFKEGTRVPEKSSGLDHAADALGYLVGAVFPTYSNTVSITNAFTGADLMA
jgi:Terminase large subunit, T4likevirus-type, N-terminal